VQALVDDGAALLVKILTLPKPIVGANETLKDMKLPVVDFELTRARLMPRHYLRAVVQETALNIAAKLGALPNGSLCV